MFLTVLLLFVTSSLICSAAPTLENDHCGKPDEKEGATLQGNWNAETYSPGTVAKFACVNGYIRDGPIRMACIEGSWLDISKGQCKISGYCSKPQQSHENGELEGQWNDETFPPGKVATYICRQGYSQTSPIKKACIEGEWITVSKGQCIEDIVCYKETVRNGIVLYTKETYKDGETVTLTCNEGYQIEHKPEEPRTCTAHGWSPPLNCISRTCSQPNPQNGYIKDRYNFPIRPDAYYKSIYYSCDSGYLSKDKKNYWGETTCTKTGWNPEPKCYKKCDVPSSDSMNANFQHLWSQIYIEGDKLQFQCYRDHKTSNGQTTGEIECLPDGKFSAEKCSKSCQKPNLANMEYKTNENVFEVGAYFIYKCKEGFISRDNKVDGVSQCGNDGWQPYPECRGIFCTLNEKVGSRWKETKVPFGKVVYFTCPENTILEGSSSIQCFHNGWSSSSPICTDGTIKSSPTLDLTKRKESKCPSIAEPSNARVINPKTEYFNGDEIEIECDPGYQMYGSEKGLCKDGEWQSPPWCTEKKRCTRNPPQIPNGEISEESVADQYYSGSTVKYICADGYRIIGSDESKCIDGKWLPLPICEGNSCGKPREILNGRAEDGRREYKHCERASYICNKGYKLSQAEPASCDLGTWKEVPQCIDSSCGLPPKMTNGKLKEEPKTTYLSGDRATYECSGGYTMKQNANFITCENSRWTELPVCRKIGQTCGPPPVVQFGDITEIKQKTYQSGSSVIYKCANFYKLEGEQKITCRDGEWEKEPVCRVPCTVKETDLQQNNIQFKFKPEEEKRKKLYIEHTDSMSFECRPGYQISDKSLLRIPCLEGVIKYPRCLKEEESAL